MVEQAGDDEGKDVCWLARFLSLYPRQIYEGVVLGGIEIGREEEGSHVATVTYTQHIHTYTQTFIKINSFNQIPILVIVAFARVLSSSHRFRAESMYRMPRWGAYIAGTRRS